MMIIPADFFPRDLSEVKQLAVVEVLGVVVSISDGFVFVHDLKTLEPLVRLEKTKGCTAFAIDIQQRSSFCQDHIMLSKMQFVFKMKGFDSFVVLFFTA